MPEDVSTICAVMASVEQDEFTVTKTRVRRSYIDLLAEVMAATSALLPPADKSAASASPMSADDVINTWWLNSEEISIGLR